MRQAELPFERLRIDLQDFWARGHPLLQGGQAWAALGKHLCGAATDFSLRCCLADQHSAEDLALLRAQPAAAPEPGQQPLHSPCSGCRGLAIATCCHHRCTWQAGHLFVLCSLACCIPVC